MKSKSGFTIVELLIVIIVIAILAAITIVTYNGINKRASESAVAAGIRQVRKELENNKSEFDMWSSGSNDFCTAATALANQRNLNKYQGYGCGMSGSVYSFTVSVYCDNEGNCVAYRIRSDRMDATKIQI